MPIILQQREWGNGATDLKVYIWITNSTRLPFGLWNRGLKVPRWGKYADLEILNHERLDRLQDKLHRLDGCCPRLKLVQVVIL